MNSIPWPALFAEHRRYLWSVCYRLTGDVQDAEDLVQATFERAMQRPPDQLDRPWRPWLTRVASNLAIDLLRRRAQQAYDGPWLPAPVEELLEVEGWTRDHHGGEVSEFEVRFGQLESARLAFLLALETLDPRARAVLILRDVLGYSGPEVGEFLDLTAANVRVILHRARKALEHRRSVSQDPHELAADDARVREAIERFMSAILSGDPALVSALLAEDARVCTDAGGEFVAARKLVTGRASATKLLLGIATAAPTWAAFRQINGEPALVLALPPTPLRTARHAVLHIELDADGRIAQLQLHLATRKLVGVDFDSYNPDALAYIRSQSPHPISSCETLMGLREFLPYFRAQAMDVAIIDGVWNGMWQSMKIAASAEAHEVNVAPHNFYGHLCSMMNAHFAAAVPHLRIMEIDIDRIAWDDELFTHAPEFEDGHLVLPDRPGWGTEPDEEGLKAHPPRDGGGMLAYGEKK